MAGAVKRYAIPLAPALALLITVPSLTGCGKQHAHTTTYAALTMLHGSAAPVVDAFNAALRQPRVLLIVSPT